MRPRLDIEGDAYDGTLHLRVPGGPVPVRSSVAGPYFEDWLDRMSMRAGAMRASRTGESDPGEQLLPIKIDDPLMGAEEELMWISNAEPLFFDENEENL